MFRQNGLCTIDLEPRLRQLPPGVACIEAEVSF